MTMKTKFSGFVIAVTACLSLAAASAPAVVADSSAKAPAAKPRCAGQVATIVGNANRPKPIKGTPGRDVIVTNGQRKTESVGGNDLICVTGPNVQTIVAGDGDDRILLPTGRKLFAYIKPGPGNDFVRGGAGDDKVYQEEKFNGTDTINTGGGDDIVIYPSTGRTRSKDKITLGAGDDEVLRFANTLFPAGGAVIAGGPGYDKVNLNADESRDQSFSAAQIDMTAGTIVTDIGTVKVPDIEYLFISANNPDAEITYKGTAGSDNFSSFPFPVSTELLGGNDTFKVSAPAPEGAVVDGGTGRNTLDFDIFSDLLIADLSAGTATMRFGARINMYSRLNNFSDVLGVSDGDIELTGTDGPNRFAVNGCSVTVDAGDGDDTVAVARPDEDSQPQCDPLDSWSLNGEGDNDKLTGSSFNDVIIGGDGTDTADGGQGADACDAETETACETDPLPVRPTQP